MKKEKEIKEQQIVPQSDSDLIYACKQTALTRTQSGMIRDLFWFAKQRKKGIMTEFMQTGNQYIDEVAEIIRELTEK